MFGRCRRAAFAASCLALWPFLEPAVAWAQAPENSSAEELAAARFLFAEALRDEQAQRFLDALQKFQRVRAVRDTASIEYRIGSCYDGIGQAVPAYEAYRDAIVLGQGDARSADVVSAAAGRLQVLTRHVARLKLALPEVAPADAEVRVDDRVVVRAALRDAIALEPGPHVVTATASGATPFRSEMALTEGAEVSLTISLEPRTTSRADAGGTVVVVPTVAVVPDAANRTGGWIGVAGGGALLVGSAVLALVQQNEISRLNEQCPAGACRASSNPGDLESTRSRALAEGAVAIALLVGGVVAAGIGAYFVFKADDRVSSPHARGTYIVPLVGWEAGGLAVSGVFR
jgi:hypothetical protein